MRTYRGIAAAAAATLLLGACGGNQSAEPEPQVTVTVTPSESSSSLEPSPSETVDVDARRADGKMYFEAIFADEYDIAKKLSAKDSAAYRLAIHREDTLEADIAGGFDISEFTGDITSANGGDSVVVDIEYDDGAAGEPSQVTYFDFRYDEADKLVDFKAKSPDQPAVGFVGDRLWTKPATFEAAGARVTLGSAFRSASSGNLVVTLHLTAPKDEGLNLAGLFSATYRNPSGDQVQAGDYFGPTELQPGATATGSVHFPRSEIGGQLQAEFWGALNESMRHGVIDLAVK